jgi:hypothetical protein
MDLREVLSALSIDRRNDTRPVEREREAREFVERAVFQVGYAEELCAGRRPARRDGSEMRGRGWAGEGGRDGGCWTRAGGR